MTKREKPVQVGTQNNSTHMEEFGTIFEANLHLQQKRNQHFFGAILPSEGKTNLPPRKQQKEARTYAQQMQEITRKRNSNQSSFTI